MSGRTRERTLSMATRQELIQAIRGRYREASRPKKKQILDEFVAVTGYHRKHALRLLNENERVRRTSQPVRRVYDEAVRQAVVIVWEAADRICGKRLKAALPGLVAAMERHGHLSLDEEVRRQLLEVSAATMDRMLAPMREAAGLGRRRRSASISALKRRVPIRTFSDWDDPAPGYFEADFVVHCGGSLAGSVVHSFVLTDVASGWTESVPLIVREQALVVEAIKLLRTQLPVPLKGIDTDNDSAFINESLIGYCEAEGLELTRSRPYRKNDQAWIEQKNGAVVRRLVGYGRLEGAAATRALIRLARVARLYVNFFQPSFKLREKVREGGKVRKHYFPPATPCERLLGDARVNDEAKDRLRATLTELDPVVLLRDLRTAQAEVAAHQGLGNVEPTDETTEDVDLFLAQFPMLWKMGEVRPTHRVRPRKTRTWRTRIDPFEDVWPEIRSWLEAEPDLTGKRLFDRLEKEYPGQHSPGQLRTLQRRVRGWRQAAARALIATRFEPNNEVGDVLC